MTVAFKQPIVAGEHGRDVMATKRALRAMRFAHISLKRDKAGKAWEASIRSVQHQHALTVDGVYGPKTHAVVAPHMDAYARWLYTHARLRHHSDYVNPFQHATVEVGRVDAGCDYHGHGPIGAIGDAVICGSGNGPWTGWPGGTYLFYRLLSGTHAGRFVYVAEAVNSVVRTGQHVKAGQTVCNFGFYAAPGLYPGIETGWSSNLQNVTYADATREPSGPGRSDTAAGEAFARFLKSIGAPAPEVPPGPEFPT